MPVIEVRIDATVGQQKFAQLRKALDAPTLLKLIGARLMSHVDESFKTRGRGAWRPLSQLTLLLRRRGGDAPLQDTGRYKQSWVQESDGRTFVEVGSNLKVPGGLSLAKIHEYGTAPYTIRARNAKVLAAETRMGTWLHFGKEVNHPGVPARPVLPTKAVAERLIQQVANAALARVAGGAGGGG